MEALAFGIQFLDVYMVTGKNFADVVNDSRASPPTRSA
jgi:hypothetical protein